MYVGSGFSRMEDNGVARNYIARIGIVSMCESGRSGEKAAAGFVELSGETILKS